MSSTGNDIVALNESVVAKAAQPRFYSKIMAAGEMAFFHEQAADKLSLGEYVWLLWSVKESVYKFLKRMQPGFLFSPQKIMVHQLQPPAGLYEESWRCTVLHGETTIHTQTFFHASFLHTVAAADENFTGITWGTGFIKETGYDSQSAGVRSLLAEKINELLPGKTIVLQKDANGIPLLFDEENNVCVPVSFSHDGHFLAYSFYLQPAAEAILAELVC